MTYLLVGFAAGFALCFVLHSPHRKSHQRARWLSREPAWKEPEWQ